MSISRHYVFTTSNYGTKNLLPNQERQKKSFSGGEVSNLGYITAVFRQQSSEKTAYGACSDNGCFRLIHISIPSGKSDVETSNKIPANTLNEPF